MPDGLSPTDTRRFLRTFGITIGLMLAVLATITAVSYRFGLIDVATRWVYDYQLEKIEKADEIDIVFVGDSSLGNAIDAQLFGELADTPTANLALAGTYGVGASFNMIRRAAERHDVKSAVVMQSLNTMTRTDTNAGYFFTTSKLELSELSPIDIAKLYLSYRTAKETIQQVRRKGFHRERPKMEGDYVAQRQKDRMTFDEAEKELVKDPLLPGMLSQVQIRYVARIAAYCEEQGIACTFAHGPIYDGYCRNAAPYIEVLNEAITAAGLPVVEGTPRCMTPEEIGDGVDHVTGAFKQAYTRWYHEQIGPYLHEEAQR